MLQFLSINKLELKKFLGLVLLIQIIILGLVGMDLLGFPIPILREFFGFIYLLIIPGLLLLRIFNINETSIPEHLLYSVGLSLSTLMFLGLLLNQLFSHFHPLDSTFLLLTLTILVLGLSLICYLKERNSLNTYQKPYKMNIEIFKNPISLILILLPFISILSTYLMNYYNQNLLSLFLICLICLIVIYITLKSSIPNYIYYLAIFSISISLLYNTTLITNYIWGGDIQYEYYLSNLVLKNSFWDQSTPIGINGMLSIVMLAPIFSKVMNLNLIWVFKLVYPTVFSLLPVALFSIYKKQFGNKTAFLSTFFFMSFVVFYVEMMQLARQQIAELFLVLLILLMLNSELNNVKRSLLFVIFGLSIIISHYGLSYLFVIFLGLVTLISIFVNRNNFNKYFSNLTKNELTNFSVTFIILFIVSALTWYLYVSSASNFNALLQVSNNVIINLTDLFNPVTSQGSDLILTQSTSLLHKSSKYIQLIAQILITIGILVTIFTSKKNNINSNYLKFSMAAFFILVLSIVLPFFASALNVTRIYHIALIFLAPFLIVGVKQIFNFIITHFKRLSDYRIFKNPFIILSLFVVIFFLFNNGFIYQVTQDQPTSFSFNKNIDTPEFQQEDVLGADWILYHQYNKTIYADDGRYQIFGGLGLPFNFKDILDVSPNSLIYLGTYNTKNQMIGILIFNSTIPKKIYTPVNIVTNSKSQLYDNGGSEIFYNSF